ncbi:MAG: hypothetical protein P4L16_05440 [Chlamydiales bacterium]|nr:hypothetical protein [Chlamydiales bacterium]
MTSSVTAASTSYSLPSTSDELQISLSKMVLLLDKEKRKIWLERYSGFFWKIHKDSSLSVVSEEAITYLNALKPLAEEHGLQAIFECALDCQARMAVIHAIRIEGSFLSIVTQKKREILNALVPDFVSNKSITTQSDEELDEQLLTAIWEEPIPLRQNASELEPNLLQTRLSFQDMPLLSPELFKKITDSFPNATESNMSDMSDRMLVWINTLGR